MERLTPELAAQMRDARRAKRLSQAALAREAGCTQSAVSMMEMGRADALSRETLRKIGALLDVEVGVGDKPTRVAGDVSAAGRRVCCPQPECPSNVPFAVGGVVVFWPRSRSSGDAGCYCAYCGEVLLSACPGCGRPLWEGGHCRICGAAYVNPPDAAGASAEVWAAERRRQIAEWHALL